MSNNISFTGRLGQDPESKVVGETPLLILNVANNVGFGDKKTTNWFRCNIWGKQASTLSTMLKKGSEVFITGELKLGTYTNKEGAEKTSVDVRVNALDFCGSKKDSASEDEAF
jgi:single-strand DNA-binding protein